MRTHWILIWVILLALLLSSPVLAEVIYNITDLGEGSAYGINDYGQVVGSFGLWQDGNVIPFGGTAYSINNSGQIVGTSSGRAIMFDTSDGGANVDLGRGAAYSINNSGQIVGVSRYDSYDRATLFDPTGEGNNVDLGTLGGLTSKAYSINDNDQIGGLAKTHHPQSPWFAHNHATLFDSTGAGNNQDLGTLGRPGTLAEGNAWIKSINNSGQAVGVHFGVTLEYTYHIAVLFGYGDWTDNIGLGTLGGVNSYANSINNNGWIVGYAEDEFGVKRATLFDGTGDGNNIDLNELIEPTLGWTLTTGNCINDDGWIVGEGISPDGHTRAYLLTPIPPPIEATIRIDPNTLNLKSKGKWITCHIWLPEDYNVAEVDPNSIQLGNEPNSLAADWMWFEEEEEFVMAKFSRSALQEMLAALETPTQVELLITGELADGTIFEGTDTIRVVDKGKKSKLSKYLRRAHQARRKTRHFWQ